jgi:hypothetical protein
MKSKRFVVRLDLEFDNEVDENELSDLILEALTHKVMPAGQARVASKPALPDDDVFEPRHSPPQKHLN